MAESKIETACKKHLKNRGWLVLKFGVGGWPDNYCWLPEQKRTVWFEMKDTDKTARALQEYRIRTLIETWKVEAYVIDSLESLLKIIP